MSFIQLPIASSTGITVGGVVTGGTNTRIFFQASGVVSQSANLTFNNGTSTLFTSNISTTNLSTTTLNVPSLGLGGVVYAGIGGNLLTTESEFFWDVDTRSLGVGTQTFVGVEKVRIKGDQTEPVPPTDLMVAATYDVAGFNTGQPQDLRVYSYKDVCGVRYFSSTYINGGYIDDGSFVGPAPTPTGLGATINYGAGSYTADNNTIDYEVYGYSNFGIYGLIYSASFSSAGVVDDGSSTPYSVDLSWSGTSDGYILVRSFNGGGFIDSINVGGVNVFNDDNTAWVGGFSDPPTPVTVPRTYDLNFTWTAAVPAADGYVIQKADGVNNYQGYADLGNVLSFHDDNTETYPGNNADLLVNLYSDQSVLAEGYAEFIGDVSVSCELTATDMTVVDDLTVGGDIVGSANLSVVDNVTVGGTVSGTWVGSVIDVPRGGTGTASFSAGSVPYYNGSAIVGSNMGYLLNNTVFAVANPNGGTTAAYKVLVVRGNNTGQTGNVFETQNSSATTLTYIDPIGSSQFGSTSIADVSSLGSEKLTNGTFTGSATGWTLGTGWAYNSNNVIKNANGTGTLSQTSAGMVTPLVVGETYLISYVISSMTVTGVTASIAGVTLNAANINGTYSQVFRALSTADLVFTPTNTSRFIIDTISLKKVTDGDLNVVDDLFIGSDTNILDGGNIVLGTGTGTKIGTGTTQKFAFYNTAPIAQYATTGTVTGFTANISTPVLADSTFTGNTGSTAYTIGDIVRSLKLLGLIAA